MQVLVDTRDPDAAALRGMAVRRVRFVMRRLTWLVRRTSVHLVDAGGPRGGADKRCRIELKTDRAGTVVITSLARDWRLALDGALARAAAALVRSWRRRPEPAAPCS